MRPESAHAQRAWGPSESPCHLRQTPGLNRSTCICGERMGPPKRKGVTARFRQRNDAELGTGAARSCSELGRRGAPRPPSGSDPHGWARSCRARALCPTLGHAPQAATQVPVPLSCRCAPGETTTSLRASVYPVAQPSPAAATGSRTGPRRPAPLQGRPCAVPHDPA